MDRYQAHLETLRRLDEEAANLHELYDTYYCALKDQFPKRTKEELQESNILRSLISKIDGNKRNREYCVKNQTAYRHFGLDESGYTRLKKDYEGKSVRYAKAFL